MPTAHLVFGFLGVGKTTFAEALAERVDGVLLSKDEWYLRLYTDGEPTHHMERDLYDRLSAALDDLWPAILGRGVDVVLDFGFWRRSERHAARRRAADVGGRARLYQLSCDESVARERLLARNDAPGWSFQMFGDAYDELRVRFEPLGADETFDAIDTTA